MKKTTFILLGILITNLWATQAVAQEVEMADTLRQDGKIWVVVAVITVVFAGIIAYLVSLDRKIGKLENKIK
jgi:CcmD family protein